MKFLIDQTIIKIGRYLRFLGFDAVLVSQLDETLARKYPDRIFVTSSKRHYESWPTSQKILLPSQKFDDQFRELLRQIPLTTEIQFLSRCSICNELLQPVRKEAVVDQLPPLVIKNIDSFYRCPKCGKIYWDGTHVMRLINKLERLGIQLKHERS